MGKLFKLITGSLANTVITSAVTVKVLIPQELVEASISARKEGTLERISSKALDRFFFHAI